MATAQDADDLNWRTITLSEEDFHHASRLFAVLSAQEQSRSELRSNSDEPEVGKALDRHQLVKRARAASHVRKRRQAIFGKAILGEPAFDLLLALYVYEERNPRLSVSRLAELADVPPSTANRWIDYLEGNALVAREPHLTDKRKSVIALTDKGRNALDEFFSGFSESGLDLV